MSTFLWLIFGVLSVLRRIQCGNILILCDVPSRSHQIWNYALAEGLIQKGHNITYLSPDADKMKATDKYHPLVIEGLSKYIHEYFELESDFSTGNPLKSLKFFFEWILVSSNYTYRTNGFRTLMNYPNDYKFDLVIIDLTLSFGFTPFIQKFNYPPAIGITAFLLPPYLSHVFGNDVQPAYLPFHHLNYDEDMNIFQRTANYLMIHLEMFLQHFYIDRVVEDSARKAFGSNMDSIESLKSRISLLLCNLDQNFHQPQPLPPNIIAVGGLHAKSPKKLPEDLQDILDNAVNGLIYFSLGTNVQSDKLDLSIRNNFLEAFGRLKQTVLWKFESKLTGLPENVFIRKWLPQNDILAHPNVKLFISHGGGLSTLETAFHGVPIIGIPFFVDQLITVSNMVKKKVALRLDITASSQEIYETIQKILTNPIYNNNMKDMSKRMRDQPETPLQRAIFWSEYAMKHDGGKYLMPKSTKMSLFVSSNTDVKLFLTFLASLLIYLLIWSWRKIRSFFIKNHKEKKQ